MTERKIYCYDCNKLIGKLDLSQGSLRMLPDTEWTISGTCADCLKSYETPKTDGNMSLDDLMNVFGIKK